MAEASQCPKCGSAVGADANFCPACGSALERREPDRTEALPVVRPGAGDVPMPGYDIDLDGIEDEAIFRPAGSGAQIWYRRSGGSGMGYNVYNGGMTGDVVMWMPDENGDNHPELLFYRRAGTPVGRLHRANSISGGTYSTFSWVATTMVYSDLLL